MGRLCPCHEFSWEKSGLSGNNYRNNQGDNTMKLQELIDKTDLDITELQVKAFFLGAQSAERPLPFNLAMDELIVDDPEAHDLLEAEFKKLWDELAANYKVELSALFPEIEDLRTFMDVARGQLDYFLMALSLAGTTSETCKDQDLAELIDELEDTVEDLDDYLADEDASDKDGEDFKGFLVDTWADFVASKQ